MVRGVRSTRYYVIKGEVVITADEERSGPGKLASIQLYSRTNVDPNTGKGMLSKKARLKKKRSKKDKGLKVISYSIRFKVQREFGIPGALSITSKYKHRFFLQHATFKVSKTQIVHFDCKSWVYPINKTKTDRIFFTNTIYLPNQTPEALVELRREELNCLRGDGTGERKEWDRIYDYDYYNDLGNPDKGQRHARQVLGGSVSNPYPRRLRTGRPPSKKDPLTESRGGMFGLDVFVPADERISPRKIRELISASLHTMVHSIIPESRSLFREESDNFDSFYEIRQLFSCNTTPLKDKDKLDFKELKKKLSNEELRRVFSERKKNLMSFPLPQIIAENEWAWKDDDEFARQMLAGTNPTRIELLQKFPPQSRAGVRSCIKVKELEANLDGLSLEEAIWQCRMFLLDHHDYLMPFLSRINTTGICAYASRTFLFLRDDDTLKPVAIELSLPGSWFHEEIQGAFLPASHGIEAAIWQLAKTHVAANDSTYHQLIRGWLHTHAVVEPFIIATRRQLSVMHPIHWLLDPHFKDTIHINALARGTLINSGGILEKTLFTGELSMKMSSLLYKEWRFHKQTLPLDLVKRGMAIRDPDSPAGVQLLLKDYPYAVDGLDIWIAIKTWVTDFCLIFYKDDSSITSDEELQAWWTEIRNVGHGDKQNETRWFELTNLSNLIEALTILIWIASALHASLTIGQYAYAGYPLNRPTLCRRHIPGEGTFEFAEFLRDPDDFFLKMLPNRTEMTLGIAMVEFLSQHASDEVFLGQRPQLEWMDNEEVQEKFAKFNTSLREIEKKIMERNRDPTLKNRHGPANIPYECLFPNTSNERSVAGITGMGIPNSISI